MAGRSGGNGVDESVQFWGAHALARSDARAGAWARLALRHTGAHHAGRSASRISHNRRSCARRRHSVRDRDHAGDRSAGARAEERPKTDLRLRTQHDRLHAGLRVDQRRHGDAAGRARQRRGSGGAVHCADARGGLRRALCHRRCHVYCGAAGELGGRNRSRGDQRARQRWDTGRRRDGRGQGLPRVGASQHRRCVVHL